MRKKRIVLITSVLVFFLCGLFIISKIFLSKKRPPPYQNEIWSIGIYEGDSPFSFSDVPGIANPVLTAQDVSDAEAVFVADPFMIREEGTWYMFFEVFNKKSHHGDIGMATSDDGRRWAYQQIVLDEPFHLSYPYVFKWNNEFYIIPESHESGGLQLYKAVNFPFDWACLGTLVKGDFVDPSILFRNQKIWLFTETNPEGNDRLCLYYADSLMGPWISHPKNPLIDGDANIARPGGRIIWVDGQVIRFAQDDDPTYGNRVRAFEITELTTESYKERELLMNPPLKGSSSGWNADGMHHIDLHQLEKGRWIACVDGCRFQHLNSK
ncbi:hypothetical protein ACFLT2_06030 [Acidobacteriota bacterium]